MQQLKDSLTPDPLIHNSGANPPCLLDYIEIVVKRRRMIITITIVTTLICIIYAFMLPDIYTSTAKLLPPQQQSGLMSAVMMQGALAAIGGESLVGESKNARLYSEILKMESLRDAIIERFKLQEVYGRKFRQDVYKDLKNKVIITTGKEGIITIAVDDKDPKRSADIANAFVDELKKLTSRLNMTGAGNSRSFLEDRIIATKKDLLDAENALKAFQAKYKILDAQQQGGATMGVLTQLTGQLTTQEIQLNTILRSFSENSQEVRNQRQAIAALRTQIAKFEKSGSGVLPGFENVPERGQEYLHLMRKYKTAEAVYDMLSRQYESSRLNEANNVSTIQVIQNAVVPERKSKPGRRKMIQIAFFISLIGSCTLALLLESLGGMPAEDKNRWKSLLRFRKR